MRSKQLLSIMGCGLAALSSCAAGKKQVAEKPNILFILADDHARTAISAYGGINSKLAPTPNIDAIGENGAIMQNMLCTNSISGPSRACLLTGKYSTVMDFIRMKVVLYLTIPNSSIRRYCVTMDIPLRFLASGICFPILQGSTTIKFMPMPVNRVLIGTLYIVPMAEKQKRKAMPRNLPRPMLCNGLTAYVT